MAAVSFRVTGGNRAHQLGRRLKALNDKALEKELKRGITRAMRPATKAVKTAVPQYMPSGYAPVLAKALQLRTSNLASGLRVTGQARGNPRPREVTAINRGVLRHPLFGNRDRWYAQQVTPRFFHEPLEKQASQIRTELDRVLAEVAAKITS